MRTACFLFSGLALLASACGGGTKENSKSAAKNDPPPTVDLKRGSFGGVALGDSVEKMHRVFGPASPIEEGEPATALSLGDEADYSPPVLASGPEAGPGGDAFYRYENVVFLTQQSKVGAIIVNHPEARIRGTDLGFAGDLSAAAAAYELQCGIVNANSEYEPFSACVGRTAPRVFVWFGKDPINNITLSRVRPGGLPS